MVVCSPITHTSSPSSLPRPLHRKVVSNSAHSTGAKADSWPQVCLKLGADGRHLVQQQRAGWHVAKNQRITTNPSSDPINSEWPKSP